MFGPQAYSIDFIIYNVTFAVIYAVVVSLAWRRLVRVSAARVFSGIIAGLMISESLALSYALSAELAISYGSHIRSILKLVAFTNFPQIVLTLIGVSVKIHGDYRDGNPIFGGA